jgi:hypothetical protein
LNPKALDERKFRDRITKDPSRNLALGGAFSQMRSNLNCIFQIYPS